MTKYATGARVSDLIWLITSYNGTSNREISKEVLSKEIRALNIIKGFGASKRDGGGIYEYSSFRVEKFIQALGITKKRGFYPMKKIVITLMVEIIKSMFRRRVNEIVVRRPIFHMFF